MTIAFVESRFETGYILYGTEGGPEFSTSIVAVTSGYEKANQNWAVARGSWNFGDRKLPDTELNEIIKFFRARKGKAIGFRFKDWGDYQDGGTGYIGVGYGDGTPGPHQMAKSYSDGGASDVRLIKKPVSGFKVYRGSILKTIATNYTVDTTTGLITWVADASSSVNSATPGTTTTLVLTTNPGNLAANNKLYVTGFTGTGASRMNSVAHTINSVSGSGPYTFVLATNTNTFALGGAATGYSYPQPGDALTWTGEFDTPVRFDTDKLTYRFDSAQMSSPGTVSKKYFYLNTLPLIEIRL